MGEPSGRRAWEGSACGDGGHSSDAHVLGGSGLGNGDGCCRRVHAAVVAPLFDMLRAVVRGGTALREAGVHAGPVGPV